MSHMKTASTIAKSTTYGTVGSSQTKTRTSSGALRKVATTSSKSQTMWWETQLSVSVESRFASAAEKKITFLQAAVMSRSGWRRSKMTLRIWLGLRQTPSLALNAGLRSRKTKVACIWPAANAGTVSAGSVLHPISSLPWTSKQIGKCWMRVITWDLTFWNRCAKILHLSISKRIKMALRLMSPLAWIGYLYQWARAGKMTKVSKNFKKLA